MVRMHVMAAVGTMLAGAVHATDLPRRAAPPVFLPPAGFSWTGVYAGATAGYAFTDNLPSVTAGTNPAAQFALSTLGLGRARTEASGFAGGGGIGFNFQVAPGAGPVIGAEADIQATDLDRRRVQGSGVGPALVVATTRQSLDWLGTVRGRVGYAFDRVLVYGTGGFAYGDVGGEKRFGLAIGPGAPIPLFAGRAGLTSRGYVYGGGIEYALPGWGFLGPSSAVTVKVEYLRYDLGGHTVEVNGVGLLAPLGTQAVTRFNAEGNIVRAGLNVKFGI